VSTLTELARLTRLVETDAHEGPVYAPGEHALYFTTNRPRVAIRRLDLATRELSTVRAEANMANGMALDRDGRLLVCEQGTRWSAAAITRLDVRSGRVDLVVDRWLGLRLNSPNDIAVAPDGTVWFTDPGYGFLQGFRHEPELGDYVFRHDPRSGGLSVVADTFDKPNGLAFSPDGAVLYVGDSGAPGHVKAFDVISGARLASERVFAAIRPGHPDGLAVDREGRVYASAADGIHVFSPDGARIGEIALPGAVNFTFGGPGGLLITADDAIWAAELDPTALRG
jgi:gluconolactonase